MMTLYTNGTADCITLEKTMTDKGLKLGTDYEINTDLEVMKDRGFLSCPKLEINDTVLGFAEAMGYVMGLYINGFDRERI